MGNVQRCNIMDCNISLNILSRDALTLIMRLVPNVRDWARFLTAADQTPEVQWRLLSVKPEKLTVTLDDLSLRYLQQAADYRYLHPNVNIWPHHVHLKLSGQSSATTFVALVIPLLKHVESFELSMNDVQIFKPNTAWSNNDDNLDAVNDVENIALIDANSVMNRFNLLLSTQRDRHLVKHLPLTKDHCDELQRIMSHSPKWLHTIHIGITTGIFMANVTTLKLALYANWSDTHLAFWPSVIARAQCLTELQIDFINIDEYGNIMVGNNNTQSTIKEYSESLDISTIKSPYLTRLAIRAHCYLDLILPSSIPSLRHLTLGAKSLTVNDLAEPLELTSLALHQHDSGISRNHLQLYNNTLYCTTSLRRLVIDGLDAHKTQLSTKLSHLFNRAPLLTDLTFTCCDDLVECFLKHPQSAILPVTITRLRIETSDSGPRSWSDHDLTPFIEPLVALQYLKLRRIHSILGKTDNRDRYICDIQRFPKSITHLDLSYNSSIKDLLEANFGNTFPKLTYLDMSGNQLNTFSEYQKVTQWAQQSLPSTLRHLNMSACSLIGLNVPKLSHLNQLETLDLRRNSSRPQFVQHDHQWFALLKSTFLCELPSSLKRLWLPPVYIDDSEIVDKSSLIILTHKPEFVNMMAKGIIDMPIYFQLGKKRGIIGGFERYHPASPIPFKFKDNENLDKVRYWRLKIEPM